MPVDLLSGTETMVKNMLVSRDERIKTLEELANKMLELANKVHDMEKFKHQENTKKEKEDRANPVYETPGKSQRSRWARG